MATQSLGSTVRRSFVARLRQRTHQLAAIRPTRLTLLILGVLAALSFWSAVPVGAASTSRSSDTVIFSGIGVVDVQKVQGFKSTPDQFGRLLDTLYSGSEWDFYGDGTFIYTPNADGVGTEAYLYPIVGVWDKNGDGTFTLKGESAAALSNQASSDQTVQQLRGVLYQQGSHVYMDIQETDVQGSNRGTATYTIELTGA